MSLSVNMLVVSSCSFFYDSLKVKRYDKSIIERQGLWYVFDREETFKGFHNFFYLNLQWWEV